MNTIRPCILCATDFSSHAKEAAGVAAKLALRENGKLLLVHSVDAPGGHVAAALNRRLETDAAVLRKTCGNVESVLLQGARPTDAFVAYVREQQPVLVVVGGGVKSALDRWALGSFSERVAEGSPVPTLVVRNAAAFANWDGFKTPLTILLALDFSATSDVVLRWARQFGHVGACDFVACHVNWRVPTSDDAGAPATAMRNTDATQSRLERELRKKVRDQLGDESVQYAVQPFFGDPGAMIVEIAEEKKVQLIAVGAHQRRGIHRLAQFSVSRDILHLASLNVVCVPVQAKFDARDAHIPEFRRVLVATDLSELGNTAVPFACAACAIGGLVKIVHVATAREAKREGIGGSAKLRARLRELIPDETGTRCQPPEVQVLVSDDVPGAICAEAESFGADLVCMTSHGLGASRALHGSIAKALLKRIRRPLLVIRRPE
jgi:nucleotide-binding universal stress UspA family protein